MDISAARITSKPFCRLANKQLTKRQNVVLQLKASGSVSVEGKQCPHFSVKGDRFCCSLALHLTSLTRQVFTQFCVSSPHRWLGFMDIHKSLYCLEWLCIWTVYPLKAWMASSAFRRPKQPGSRTHTQPCLFSLLWPFGKQGINASRLQRKKVNVPP